MSRPGYRAFLLLAYSAGSATALAVILGAGIGVLGFVKQHLGLGVRVRSGFGMAVLGGVAVATGTDRDILARVIFADTAPIEQWLVDHAAVRPAASKWQTQSSTGLTRSATSCRAMLPPSPGDPC